MSRSFTWFAPASIGNLSVGFDLLGLALKPIDGSLLGDQVTISDAAAGDEPWNLVVDGDYAGDLPADPVENVVTRCCDTFLRQSGKSISSPVSVRLTKSLPVSSGLGSSASSIVAAMASLNHWFDQPFGPSELLELMGEVEGGVSGEKHYDNIAPGYLGGLVLCDSGNQPPQSLPWPKQWRIVIAYRDHVVQTRVAREILPKTYHRKALVRQNARLSYFVHALHTGDLELAARNIVDEIVEPFRKQLLPEFEQARSFVMNHGAIAAGISGSGPTMFAIVDQLDTGKRLASWLAGNYARNGFSALCEMEPVGARQIMRVSN